MAHIYTEGYISYIINKTFCDVGCSDIFTVAPLPPLSLDVVLLKYRRYDDLKCRPLHEFTEQKPTPKILHIPFLPDRRPLLWQCPTVYPPPPHWALPHPNYLSPLTAVTKK